MAQVTLTVAGRSHTLACRDGEEPQLIALAERLERHAPTALHASGGMSSERTLLLIALMLADELAERDRAPKAGLPAELLDELAERLEAVASALEDGGASA
ncbi:cell division protein ZapA [Sphingomonas sp. ac-8]|uniref:cell division protein ZapA n=1 Tax=Sphingomonas sp. ac-8 TaxID=3242977 RepID=UPI003A7F8C28